MNRIMITRVSAVFALGLTGVLSYAAARLDPPRHALLPAREINGHEIAEAPPTREIAIVGATLIDGRGGPPVPDAVVVVRGARIVAAEARQHVVIPAGAEVVDGKGLTLMPGLIDAHFHLEDDNLPAFYLRHGVTSLRDPGAWIESYDPVRAMDVPIPRLFLMGPHLDGFPPAFPQDARIVRDADEVRAFVDEQVASGAMGIKAYFRLSLGLIKAVAHAAHARGVGVTTHLEIVDARQAILAGIDGIEHVTSLGVALAPAREAERFRQAILADNSARWKERYQLWSQIDIDSPRADEVIGLLVRHGVFLSPTLAVLERRAGDPETGEVEPQGFAKMMAFVGRAKRAGVRIVVGSHSDVPHAERGMAYAHEMELLLESGLSPLEVIEAATLENARNLRIEDRLGSIEPGKWADLILVEGDPLEDMSAMRRVRGVMLNGGWIGAEGMTVR